MFLDCLMIFTLSRLNISHPNLDSSVTQPKATYHHGDLPSALLDAADEVLTDKGLPGFTLRECARRAGVSHAAPKHHFGDAAGLLTRVAARGFQRLTQTLKAEVTAAEPTQAAKFQAISTGYLRFSERYPEHFRIMFRADLVNTCDEVLIACAKSTFDTLTNSILRLRGEPLVGTAALSRDAANYQDVINDIVIGWSFVHGFAHLQTEGQLNMLEDAKVTQALELAAQRLSQWLQAG